MMLEHTWVGTSEFREKINYEGTNNEISNKCANWASDREFGALMQSRRQARLWVKARKDIQIPKLSHADHCCH